MEIDNQALFDVLLEFNKYLTRKITIVSVGGTALTLLGKKSSTKDIDLCFLDKSSRDIFIRAAKMIGYDTESSSKILGRGVIIDMYTGGYIFAVQLQEAYFEKSIMIRELEKIDLFALSPLDLVITKTARLNKRDQEDIITIIKNYKIDQRELVERYIETMENSMVRDAKDHLLVLFSMVEDYVSIDKIALKKAEDWSHGRL